jgi:HEAT repeat protein
MSIFNSLIKPNISKLEKNKDVNELINIVNSNKDNDSRRKAIESLGRLNDPKAILPLSQVVSEFSVRTEAMRAIAEIQSPESIKALSRLLSNTEVDVRFKALEHLDKKRDKLAIPAIIRALYDEEMGIRKQAAIVLDRFGWIPGKDKEGAYYWGAKGDFKRIAEFGTDAIDIILDFVKIDEHNDSTRSAIEYINDPKAVDRLISLLNYRGCFQLYNSHDVQKSVIKALRNIGDPKAVDPLITKSRRPQINDGGDDVRRVAIKALGAFEDIRALNFLIACLKIKEGSLNESAAEALGDLGDPRAIDPLIALLAEKDLNWMVCEEVVKALGKIGDTRAVDPLITVYNTRYPYGTVEIQSAVVEALGNIGDERAMELLLKVSSENKEIKWNDYQVEGSDIEYIGYEGRQTLGSKARSAIIKIKETQSNIDVKK